ncbi:MAG: EamA family transporter [Magnetococcales bacterium]|nr:EamA family transporter [Magnetococcales bacterium]
MTPRLVFGFGLVIALDTAAQLLWKLAVVRLPEASDLVSLALALLTQPLFFVVLGLFLLQLFNWLHLLRHVDVSFAQPLTALSYVTVAWVSVLVLGEVLTWRKGVGVVCILVGVWIISRGQSCTVVAGERS